MQVEGPLKRNSCRETKRLIDSLGGGLESNTPRSARRKLKNNSIDNNNNNSSINNNTRNNTRINNRSSFLRSSPHSSTNSIPTIHKDNLAITHKHSDSSLSDISDSQDPHSNIHTPQATISLDQEQQQQHPTQQLQLQPPPSQSPTNTPSPSLPPTPHSKSMKPAKPSSSLRKSIIKKSHSSHFGVVRPHQSKALNNRFHRPRKLTDAQKRELEQTRLKLLENLEKEEQLIRSSGHPILVSMEENVRIGKEIKLNQARQKYDRLLSYLDILNYERQQRIWDTWTDKKVRLQNEMIGDCQIRLNRAPFEFLISSDTTNLQAIFHLTPTPPAVYNRPTVSISHATEGTGAAGEQRSGAGRRGNSRGPEVGRSHDSHPTRHGGRAERAPAILEEQKKKAKIKLSAQPLIHPAENLLVRDSLDLVQGLRRHRINHHDVWQLSHHDISHDLNLINPPCL